jgi:phospholipid/cholesterol/gamma-HCH transport system ATP-binding protein
VTESSKVVSFRNVCYAYPESDEYALEDISFDLPEGGILIVLGGSGSGKSTILKLILGLIKPESGSITVYDDDVARMSEIELMEERAKMGMVFQEGALFDSLTVAENVGFRLNEKKTLDEEQIESRVNDVLGFVGLEEFNDRMPSELSGGQRRRVAVARGMAHHPALMLYDEPTTGLDPITASTLCDLIVKLRDLEGVSSVLVTHQLRDAFHVAQTFVFRRDGLYHYQRIGDLERLWGTEFLMLDRGRMVFRGRQSDLWKTDHPYVRKFLD